MITVYTIQRADFQSSQCILQEIEEEHTDKTSEFSYDPIDDHGFSDAVLTEPETENDILSTRTTPAKKKQKKYIKDVSEVRCSQRIAKICDGFKDKEAANRAKDKGKATAIEKAPKNTRGKKKQAPSNLTGTFTAEIIHEDAPPPPKLPIDTIQAIGIDSCKIPPSEVSVEKLIAPCD
jgi:hypothetical protein